MTTYPDAVLEHYADRFILLRLSRWGISLVQYLANPFRYELLALTSEPLLPAQQAAALRIWQRWDTGLDVEGAATTPPVDPDELIDPRELMAQWRAEAEQAQQAVAHLPQRNGAIIEPLAHHRHERGTHRFSADFSRKHARKGA